MTDVAKSAELSEANGEDASKQAAIVDQENTTMASRKTEDASDNAAVAPVNGGDKSTASGGDVDADGDSEAETLIQSPEKKRNIVDNAPTLHPTIKATTKETDQDAAAAPDSDKKSKKRKRDNDDAAYEASSRASSPQSSPLSSPNLNAQAHDSDSDASNRSAPRSAKSHRTRRNATEDADNGHVQTKSKKRRPSDILPPAPRQRGKGSIDAGTSERRETRSATYPRPSSSERSPSPRPVSRRDHRRGVSTQLVAGEFERKKRGRPPHVNTRRNKSADRVRSESSEGSSSPAPNRPSLAKFSSHDPDTMSPIKAPGTRKFRDKNGRTFLSRACNNDDLEKATIYLKERPDDLDLPDNAGNTPLQIAALEGFIDIVKFLLESKANIDTRNIDKDTPLIDAVENGHVDVVKLLLDHGANPRLGNAKGEEPYELVPQDDENYKTIRKLIANAKEHNYLKRRRSNDKKEDREDASSRAASAASPRDSPGPMLGPRSPPAIASRRRTGRSESTRNDLLWQANTQENLRRLAAKGDVQGVAQVLNILGKAEAESVVAAAKAGHEEVLQYLLAMGEADPDPPSVSGLNAGYDTPILAAIGRGKLDVIRLLVEQSNFDPTKKFNKKTYYQIAAERKGENWQREHELLKNAYEKYAPGKQRKITSPRKTRDQERLKERSMRRSSSPVSSNLRNSSSPTMTHRSLPGKSPRSVPKERKGDGPSPQLSDRRKAGVPGKDDVDPVAIASDQDQIVNEKKPHKHRRSQSDANIAPNLETEPAQRRRRLMTGKDYRRAGRKSSAASVPDDEELDIEVKRESQTPGLKRTRSSMSPSPEQSKNTDSRIHVKKRRTAVESSPEESRPGPRRKTLKVDDQKDVVMKEAKAQVLSDVDAVFQQHSRERSEQSANSKTSESGEAQASEAVTEATIEVAPATEAISSVPESKPAPPAAEEVDLEAQKAEEERLKQEEEERIAEEARKAEEERLAAEKAAEERRLAEEVEAKRKAEEEALARKKEEEDRQELVRRELEDRQRRQEEQIRQQHLEIERRRREALPSALCKCALMLDNHDPFYKNPEWLRHFLPLYTVRMKQLDPSAPQESAEDEWVPNFQVACLLATKDLKLSNFTSFDKRPVNGEERDRLWKVARQMLSYDYQTNGFNTPIKQACQIEEQQRPKFFGMSDLFWVKLSDFEDQIGRHPHLSGIYLKKQPISLRITGLGGALAPSPPQANGVHIPSPKMVNGVSPYMTTPFLNGGPMV